MSKFSLKEILEQHEIGLMEYGIINRFNFSSIDKIPIKRWDPLSASLISMNQFGFHITIGKKFGHYSYISPIRASRPMKREENENKNENKNKDENKKFEEKKIIYTQKDEPIDLFQPMIEGKHFVSEDNKNILPAYTILLNDGIKNIDDPFATSAKVYKNLESNAFSMINKYPSMARVIDPDIYPHIKRSLHEMDKNARIAEGICFLAIPRNYYENIENIPNEELAAIFHSINATIKHVADSAKEQRNINLIPISPFFNVGRLVGGSLPRIHSQVYMDLSQDGHGTRMELILKAFERMGKNGKCRLCDSSHGEGNRTIIDTEEWVVFASASPIRNYHLRFAPKEHRESILDLTDNEILSLSKILKVIWLAANDIGVTSNRNIIFNTRPLGYDSYFHIFGDILPYEFVGGAEMADDMRVVRISPRKIAKQFRDIINKYYLGLL